MVFAGVSGELEAGVGFTFARFGPSPVTLGTPARTAETIIDRSGDTFTTTNTYVTDRNAGNYSWGRPTKTERSTSLTLTTRIVDTTYDHKTLEWVLGLVDTVNRNGTLFDDYNYDLQGRLTEHKRFGATWRTFGYYTTGVQAGLVSDVVDAGGHRTNLIDYKRGLPQQLLRPDNESLYRTVDDNGWIISSTNARVSLLKIRLR